MKKNTQYPSTISKPKITLVIGILLVLDILTGNLPIVSLLLILVVVTRPSWFRKVIEVIYSKEINAEGEALEARMRLRRDLIEERANQRIEKSFKERKRQHLLL